MDPDRQEIVFVLWAFAHVYIFLRKRSPTSVRPASAARDRQSQSNLFLLMHPSTAFATQPGAILLSGSELLLRGLVCRGTKWCAVTL